jgi:hypothetical protein
VDPDPDLAAALAAGQAAGAELVEEAGGGSGAQPQGWNSALHMFDYNLDRCGLGTRDEPAWKIADRDRAYATRATVARAGLWGNHGYEAAYDFVWTDEDGEPLDGSERYTVTFQPPPPVGAFWSLTMYSVPEFYLVDNAIDRYSIGDRTPGLRYADDGSVTIVLQRESPGPELESNWLPTPEGRFRPLLRSYEPGAAILDGSYPYPPVKRIT